MMTQIGWLGEIAWKGSVILILAFAAAAWLRRGPAAARHMVWTAALASLALLPAALMLAPRWSVAPAVATTAAPAQATAMAQGVPVSSAPPAVDARLGWLESSGGVWLLLWGMGALAVALRFLAGKLQMQGILRRARREPPVEPMIEELARACGIRRTVRVLASHEIAVPLACGILRPVVLLPRDAGEWSETRLGTVLRHELAHIQRWDLLAQAFGQLACCVYWFHPLVWIAARQLRQERERACDDAVLASGIPAAEYADALVDLARGLATRGEGLAGAAAMAEASDLESRVRALFDGRDRRVLTRRAVAVMATVSVALLLPVASVTMQAQAGRGSLAGTVQDPSGARVPFCRVTAKNHDGSNQEVTKADAAGFYKFGAIPPGSYTMEFASPGFALTRLDATVSAGGNARLDATLIVGSVSERMTISGQKPAAVTPSTGSPDHIRVGGNVQPVRLVRQSRPSYPPELQQAGVQGTVVIRAVISREGDVLSPQVVNTDIDPRLAKIALDAVSRWRYLPAQLNGEPIETSTTMTIDFTLESATTQAK